MAGEAEEEEQMEPEETTAETGQEGEVEEQTGNSWQSTTSIPLAS